MAKQRAGTCRIMHLTLGVILLLGGRAGTAATRSADVIEVPFQFVHNAIVVQATVDGRGPFNMMLDSGADPSVIDLATARQAGLRLATQGEQGSGGGNDANPAYETHVPTLRLGSLVASNLHALAMDLSKPAAALGIPLQGVLGQSLLDHRIVQIDYPRRVVRFYRVSRAWRHAQPASPVATLPFQYRDDIVISGVTVNGRAVSANLDTGASGGLLLTPAVTERLGLGDEAAKGEVVESTGFNGVAQSHRGKVASVNIGKLVLQDVGVTFYGKGMGVDSVPWEVRIGNGFLKDYVVTINYRDHLVTLSNP